LASDLKGQGKTAIAKGGWYQDSYRNVQDIAPYRQWADGIRLRWLNNYIYIEGYSVSCAALCSYRKTGDRIPVDIADKHIAANPRDDPFSRIIPGAAQRVFASTDGNEDSYPLVTKGDLYIVEGPPGKGREPDRQITFAKGLDADPRPSLDGRRSSSCPIVTATWISIGFQPTAARFFTLPITMQMIFHRW